MLQSQSVSHGGLAWLVMVLIPRCYIFTTCTPCVRTAPVCGVCAQGPSAEEVHPQEPVPVQVLVRGQLHRLRVHHVRAHHAQHAVSGRAGTYPVLSTKEEKEG